MVMEAATPVVMGQSLQQTTLFAQPQFSRKVLIATDQPIETGVTGLGSCSQE